MQEQSKKTGRQYWHNLNACLKCGKVVDRYAVYCAHCGALAEDNPRLHFYQTLHTCDGRAFRGDRHIEIGLDTRRPYRNYVIKHESKHVRGFDREKRLPRWLRAIFFFFYHNIYMDTFESGFYFCFGEGRKYCSFRGKFLCFSKMVVLIVIFIEIMLGIVVGIVSAAMGGF